MILEKLTVEEDSFTFFACKFLNFFTISLFSTIVTLSATKFSLAWFVFYRLMKIGLFIYTNMTRNCHFVIQMKWWTEWDLNPRPLREVDSLRSVSALSKPN